MEIAVIDATIYADSAVRCCGMASFLRGWLIFIDLLGKACYNQESDNY
ncbi:MAG: hypothetical protein K2P87_09085 [Lachnospiraceae bacterium]|nr:hypothetical protein [Lachnospiraceae bacterium]